MIGGTFSSGPGDWAPVPYEERGPLRRVPVADLHVHHRKDMPDSRVEG